MNKSIKYKTRLKKKTLEKKQKLKYNKCLVGGKKTIEKGGKTAKNQEKYPKKTIRKPKPKPTYVPPRNPRNGEGPAGAGAGAGVH